LIAFFVIGMIILLFTDTDRAIAEAKAVIDPPGS
jgi:hypothetical protein